jgi:hypothetical protein
MGLDLYHFKANAERRGKPFVIEIEKGWDALLARLSWCIATLYKDNEHFATLGEHGITSTPIAFDLFATLSDYGIETDYMEISSLPSAATRCGCGRAAVAPP